MNRRAIALLALAALLAAGILAGCSSTSTPPSDKPGIAGTVLSVTPVGNDGVSFLVATDTQTAQAKGYVSDRAMVAIDRSTKVADASGKPVDPKSISVDAPLEVWFAGPVAESYPVQGTASYIKVMTDNSKPAQE